MRKAGPTCNMSEPGGGNQAVLEREGADLAESCLPSQVCQPPRAKEFSLVVLYILHFLKVGLSLQECSTPWIGSDGLLFRCLHQLAWNSRSVLIF